MNTLYYNGDIYNAHIAEILKEIYIDRVYDFILQDRKDMIIVDLGANIGLTAQYFSRFANIVIAVEPCVAHYECLCQNVIDCGNVIKMRAAVSSDMGWVRLHHNGNLTAHGLNPALGSDYEDVPCFGINDLLLSSGKVDTVDFMKMDIEGAEYEVIASEQFALAAPRIKNIIGECHSSPVLGMTPSQENIDAIESRLKSLGFNVAWHYSEPNMLTTMFHAYRTD